MSLVHTPKDSAASALCLSAQRALECEQEIFLFMKLSLFSLMLSHFHTFSKAISFCHPIKKVIDKIRRKMHKHIFTHNRVMHVTQNSMGHLVGETSSGCGLLECVCGGDCQVCIKRQGQNAI